MNPKIGDSKTATALMMVGTNNNLCLLMMFVSNIDNNIIGITGDNKKPKTLNILLKVLSHGLPSAVRIVPICAIMITTVINMPLAKAFFLRLSNVFSPCNTPKRKSNAMISIINNAMVEFVIMIVPVHRNRLVLLLPYLCCYYFLIK